MLERMLYDTHCKEAIASSRSSCSERATLSLLDSVIFGRILQ